MKGQMKQMKETEKLKMAQNFYLSNYMDYCTIY